MEKIKQSESPKSLSKKKLLSHIALFFIILYPQKFLAEASESAFLNPTPSNNVITTSIHQETLAPHNFIITQIFIENIDTEAAIELYVQETYKLIPLQTIFDIILFPIEVDLKTETAEGWFLNEKNSFEMDAQKGSVIINGKKHTFSPKKIIKHQGELYIDSKLFEEWFKIKTHFNFPALALILQPETPLPVQRLLERLKARNKLKIIGHKKKTYPIIEAHPQLLSTPITNLNLSHSYNNTSKAHSWSYSIQSKADLLKQASVLNLSGNKANLLSNVRFNLGNRSQFSTLLGPLKANKYEIGDISALSMKRVGGGAGVGFSISNNPLSQPTVFDRTEFRGDIPPGWDVDLYYNGQLDDTTVVSEAGEYIFSDKPILYGNNVYRIVAYGPEGQVQEQVFNYNLNSNFVKKKSWRYGLSVTDKNRKLFPVTDKQKEQNKETFAHIASSLEYGLTEKLTATFKIANTADEKTERDTYSLVGLRLSPWKWLTQIDHTTALKQGGSVIDITTSKNLFSVSTNLRHTIFNNFISTSANTSNKKHSSSLTLGGGSWLKNQLGIGQTTRLSIEKGKDNSKQRKAEFRIAKAIDQLLLTNTYKWEQNIDKKSRDIRTSGTLSIRSNIIKMPIKGIINYTLRPEKTLNQALQLEYKKSFKADHKLTMALRRSFTSKITDLTLNYTQPFNNFYLSNSFGINDQGNFSLGMSLSTTIGTTPYDKKLYIKGRRLTDFSSAVAHAFLDEDYDGEWDKEEPLLPKIGFHGAGRNVTGTESGRPAIIDTIPASITTDITINESSIENPFWYATQEGYTVITRPSTSIDLFFPIIPTGEIDGTLYKKTEDGLVNAPNKIIELYDKNNKPIAITRSEFDGFFIFQKVPYGKEYTIYHYDRRGRKYKASVNEEISLDKENDLLIGLEVTLGEPTEAEKQKNKKTTETTNKPLPNEENPTEEKTNEKIEKNTTNPNLPQQTTTAPQNH